MAGASISTLSAILKDYYLPPVTEQLNNQVFFLTRINPDAESLVGNQAVVPVHTHRTGGIGVAAEGAALPQAGSQGYARATFDLKYLYARIGVTGPSRVKTSTTAGAFLQALKSEVDGARNDVKKDLARQVYGSGLGNGFVAKCGTTTASTTVQLNDGEALTKGQIYVNMIVDIVDNTNTPIANGTARTVVDVSLANKTMTLDAGGGSVTTSASNFVARTGGAGNEITGLTDIVSTVSNTVGGINETSVGNSYWANQRQTAASVSMDVLNTAFNTIKVFSGEDPSLLVSSYGIERAIYNLFVSNMRYVDTQDLKGGWKGIAWNGLSIVADVDHPWGRLHMVCEKDLKIFSDQDWHYLDDDGLTLRQVPGYDKWEAVLTRYINLGVRRRNNQLVVSGITDTGV